MVLFCFVVYYKDEVYDVVLIVIYKSLVVLAESFGCEGEVIRVISFMFNVFNDY